MYRRQCRNARISPRARRPTYGVRNLLAESRVCLGIEVAQVPGERHGEEDESTHQALMNADFVRGCVHSDGLADETVSPVSFAYYPLWSPVRLRPAGGVPYGRVRWTDRRDRNRTDLYGDEPLRNRSVEMLE
jgi:hypothetical protein